MIFPWELKKSVLPFTLVTIQSWACWNWTLPELPKLIQAVLLHSSALIVVVTPPVMPVWLHIQVDWVMNLAVGRVKKAQIQFLDWIHQYTGKGGNTKLLCRREFLHLNGPPWTCTFHFWAYNLVVIVYNQQSSFIFHVCSPDVFFNNCGTTGLVFVGS